MPTAPNQPPPFLLSAVDTAISCLFARDATLLRQDSAEWSVAHRLAVYLEQQLPTWNVDCEYNRQGDAQDPKRSAAGALRRPDIIVHHRTRTFLNHNLLIVELKRNNNDDAPGKAREFTATATGARPFQYQFGLAISKLNNESGPVLEWFAGGQVLLL